MSDAIPVLIITCIVTFLLLRIVLRAGTKVDTTDPHVIAMLFALLAVIWLANCFIAMTGISQFAAYLTGRVAYNEHHDHDAYCSIAVGSHNFVKPWRISEMGDGICMVCVDMLLSVGKPITHFFLEGHVSCMICLLPN